MLDGDLLMTILWGLFLITLVIYGVLTILLRYHWKTYALDRVRMADVTRWYFYGSAGLIILTLISVSGYGLTL